MEKGDSESKLNKTKDFWDISKIISSMIGVIIIPIVIFFSGKTYSDSVKESEIGLRYTELAIEILSNKPDSSQLNIRNWAIDILNHYSVIKLNDGVITELGESFIISEDLVYICTSSTAKKYHISKDCRGLEACPTEIEIVSIASAKFNHERTLCGWED